MTHSHSPYPQRLFWATVVHTVAVFLSNSLISLHYPRVSPADFPAYYYEFFMSIYVLVFVLVMSNLILAHIRGPGIVADTKNETDERCNHCEIYRVLRSHHCSKCHTCSMRMDHHCIWINNCVGLANQKHFVWYVFYTGFGAVYSLYNSFIYFASDYDAVYSSLIVKFLYFYLTVVEILFAYFCLCLLNLQIRLILRGLTNIEYLKEMGNNFEFLKFIVYPMVKNI
jgi:palmitoyltransferase ZDHHC3/7/25